MWRALVFVSIVATPVFAKDVVTPTGKLDLDLVHHDDAYILRDDAYAITFPAEPTVTATPFQFMNEAFPAATAVVDSAMGGFGVIIKPMPKHWVGSSAALLDEVRDGSVNGSKATVTKQTPTKLAGLTGKHISAVTSATGKRVYIELDLLWDREHRTVVGVLTTDASPKRSTIAESFVSSLSVRRGARGPIDPPAMAEGAATKLGVLDLELVRHGASYVLRDGIIEATFPARPAPRTYATTPLTIVGVGARLDDVETFGVTVAAVPAGEAYDAALGLAGTRDGFLKQFTREHHTETKAMVGGLEGKRIEITGLLYGTPARAEVRIVWDPKHRRLFSVLAITAAKALPASARAFLDSFSIAKGP